MPHTTTSSTNGSFVPGASLNGNANGATAKNTIDWNGYPALFQRVERDGFPYPKPASNRSSGPPSRIDGAREAFLGLCQAALWSPTEAIRRDGLCDSRAAARVFAAGEALGFTRDELRRLGCGVSPSPAAVREYLRHIGFSDAEITESGVCDLEGRSAGELIGSLIVPLSDETNRLRDFLVLPVDAAGRAFAPPRFLLGSERRKGVHWFTRAFGLPAADRPLVVVDDPLEALLLRAHGLHQIVFAAATDSFAPQWWEELAHQGVKEVTLAFRRDGQHAANIRDALVGALRAKSAPAVYVANPYRAGSRCLAEVLRHFGSEACATALAARTLAFCEKRHEPREPDLSTVFPRTTPIVEETPPARPVAWDIHFSDAYRRHLVELTLRLPPDLRSVCERFMALVESSISAGELFSAAWLVTSASRHWRENLNFALGCLAPSPLASWAVHFGPGREHHEIANEFLSTLTEWVRRELEADRRR